MTRIGARLDRLALGHFGDAEPVGEGVTVLRIDYGPGYRVFCLRRGEKTVSFCFAAATSRPRPGTLRGRRRSPRSGRIEEWRKLRMLPMTLPTTWRAKRTSRPILMR
ncbi:MAG: hypothetical protein OXH79_08575 [Boseongicola sp.]|nr:hypothetical protein [Boseongicola sp.]